MNFDETERYLFSLGNEVETMKLGLENIRKLLKALGNPQNAYKKVQVAGTNGKGSVCAFLDSICLQAKIHTGRYTSPHLISITERVKIDGVDISESEFARLATRVRETSERLVADGELERVPTFFEQVTAIALVAFAEAKVELAILETGLGGRFDAVTAANAEIAVITRIDLDHQEYLGDTIEKIAAEKAAIIHKGSKVCIGSQSPEVLNLIKNRCKDLGIVAKTLEFARWERNYPGFDFVMDGFTGEEVVLPLRGEHQAENAALAVRAAIEVSNSLPISEMNIILGLENAEHPGRLEEVWLDDVRVLMDGAHNEAGAAALSEFLTQFDLNKIAMVFGVVRDKNARAMLNHLLPHASVAILTRPSNSRSALPDDLVARSVPETYLDKVFKVDDVSQAFDSALQLAQTATFRQTRLVLVTGSLFLVGEVKALLKSDYAI